VCPASNTHEPSALSTAASPHSLLCSAAYSSLLRRNPASFKGSRHYETNGWFYVADSIMNLARNRYVITMPMLGLPVRYTVKAVAAAL
jgi:hypothetical protein